MGWARAYTARGEGSEGGGREDSLSLVSTMCMLLENETPSENLKTTLDYCHNFSYLIIAIF